MRGVAVAVALVAAAVAAAPAQGALNRRFIKPNGATSGSCLSIAAACDYAYVLNGAGSAANNPVTVLPGTYDVTAEPVVLARPLKITGSSSGSTRPTFEIGAPDGPNTAFQIPGAAAGTTLTHLAIHTQSNEAIEIVGGAALADLDVVAATSCVNANVDGVSVVDSSLTQTNDLGASTCLVLNGSDSPIRRTTVTAATNGVMTNGETEDLAVDAGGTGVLQIAGSLDRSIVRSNDGPAVALGANAALRDTVAISRGSRAAVDVGRGSTATARNVTAVSSGGVALHASAGTDTPAIDGGRLNARNVIARGAAADVRAEGPGCSGSLCAEITLASSNFRTSQGAVTDGGGNQSGDPLFADAPTEDFHLLSGSPAIDAGTDDGSLGATDLEGRPRTLGAAPDIGAYEFPPPGTPSGGPGGPGGGPGAPDTFPPLITHVGVTRSAIKFVLSEDAAVTLTVQRVRPGRRGRGRCVKPTRKLRRAKRCKRFVRVGVLKRNGVKGANSVPFKSKIGKRRLPAGRYRLLASAVDAAGNRSTPVKAGFRVARRR